MKKTAIATLVASCFMAAAIPAQAQTVSDNEIRIGVLTDLSGIYSAIEGPAPYWPLKWLPKILVDKSWVRKLLLHRQILSQSRPLRL